ncbi:MAG: hypothetical protein ACKOB1_10320 [Planctomycetia bacterium]
MPVTSGSSNRSATEIVSVVAVDGRIRSGSGLSTVTASASRGSSGSTRAGEL